jgi:DNA-binding winged helix-turn-helix (wHTH) protein/tetratricopeptide (TPR) repeat protein
MTDSMQPQHRRWRLGELVVDEPSLQILKGARVVTAESAQVSTLIALIDAWPEIIDKNRLIDEVWGQRIVSDAAVHKTISLLRRQLREAGARDLIETRHRMGYRLSCPPEVLVGDDDLIRAGRPDGLAARREDHQRSAFARRFLWTGAGLVLALLVWLLWPGAERSVPAEIVAGPEAGLPEADDAALRGQSIDALIELARTSIPNDLEMAELALTEARLRLASSPGRTDTSAMVDKLFGSLHFYRAEHQRAIDFWQSALAGFEASGDRGEVATVLSNLGVAHEEQDAEPARVASFYDRAIELQRVLDDQEGLARTLNNLATLWIRQQDIERARPAVDELQGVAERLAQPTWQARAVLLAADLQALQPGVDPTASFTQAYDLATVNGQVQLAAIAAQRLARSYRERAQWTEERQWLERSQRHLEAAGLSAQLPVIEFNLGLNHERQGELDQARLAYLSVIDQTAAGESVHLRVDAEVGLARLDFRAGQTSLARQRLQQALRQARLHDHALAEASVLLASGFIDLSEPDGAVAAFRAFSDAEQRLGAEPPFGFQHQLLRLQSLALIAAGDRDEAMEAVARLRRLAEERGHLDLIRDARLIEAIALLSDGQFDRGWRAHQSALGLEMIPLPVGELSAQASAQAIRADPPARASWWPYLVLLPVAFGAGWMVSSRLRNGR